MQVELTGGRQSLQPRDTIFIEEKNGGDAFESFAPITVQVRPPRPHAPSEEELQAHAAFLNTLTDPIWHRLAARG
jgi:DNA polymerase-3 subunit epsilon